MSVVQQHLIGEESVENVGLKYWQVLIDQNYKIVSQQQGDQPILTPQGKWTLQLKGRLSPQINYPLLQLIQKQFELQEEDFQIQELNQIQNIKQAFQLIGIKINSTSERFKQKYGFWEISSFRIVVKDGNTTIADWKNQETDSHYILFYQTSQNWN